MALFGLDFSSLYNAVKGFLGPLGTVLDYFKKTYDHIVGIWDAANTLKDSILEEVSGWKNFKQDIRVKQRVIQLERAIVKTKELIEGIPASWRSIIDIIKQVRTSIGGESTAVEDAEAAAKDLESGGIKELLTKFPRFARALEKLVGVLALVIDALEKIRNVIDDVQTVVDELKRLRLEIEKLDTIFLSQSNKRKTLKLADGGSIKIRLGKLHESATFQ